MCATPEGRRDVCAVCGWRLNGDLVLGALTAQDLADAEAVLGAAEHTWDLRAAALAARNPDEHRRLGDIVRGGQPKPDEAVPETTETVPATSGHGPALDELCQGRLEELSFVEAAADGLHLTRVGVTEAGIPVPYDAGSVTWRAVLPSFDSGEALRRFQLAGGCGTLPPVDRGEFDAAVEEWLAASLPADPEPVVVLLRPPPGWELLRRAAAVVARTCAVRLELALEEVMLCGPSEDEDSMPSPWRGGAEGPLERPAVLGRVRRLLRTLPLLADHTLLLARADRDTGAVRPHSHVLFPAGSRLGPGETATTEVTVHGGTAGHAPLHLPVLAGAPAADGSGAPIVTVHQVTVGALEPARLTFVLRGPGEVDLVASAAHKGGRLPEPAVLDVPRLLSRLPRRMVRPPRLELLFTVELSGADRAETEERLTFVRDVAALLAHRDHDGTAVRVGAVGHYDHADYESAWAKEGTLLRAPVLARPPAELPAALSDWAPAPRRQDTVSSLEDALHQVASLPARHPGDTEVCRVLLIVGRRPPAPPRQHGVVPACPRATDWRTALNRLRADGFRVLARVDAPAGPAPDAASVRAARYAAEAWRALGADGAFRPGTDSAQDVVRAVDPPWRHEGPECPLAFAAPLM
ncbi:hypothetical protein ACFT7S_11965 [Streptomyces sp. NPDC057136]|uniref:hypothetical protein n=1 Tax=Streptomyces sp. NPDC057136 TaxID=3346029 RepID=UPI003638D5CE